MLIDSLIEMGYAREHIEVHETAQQLIDFQGRPTRYLDKNGDRANIIVRRKHVGVAANDIGFKLEADGTYAAIISNYDSGKHNSKWLAGLKTNYNERNLGKVLKKQGFKYLGKETVNGKIQIKYIDLKA